MGGVVSSFYNFFVMRADLEKHIYTRGLAHRKGGIMALLHIIVQYPPPSPHLLPTILRNKFSPLPPSPSPLYLYYCNKNILVISCCIRAKFRGGQRQQLTPPVRVSCVGVYKIFFHNVKFRQFPCSPIFFARRSSSAARPMRTAAARRGPMDPHLASCKREATEQTI